MTKDQLSELSTEGRPVAAMNHLITLGGDTGRVAKLIRDRWDRMKEKSLEWPPFRIEKEKESILFTLLELVQELPDEPGGPRKHPEIRDKAGTSIHAGVPPGSATLWLELKTAKNSIGIDLTRQQVRELIGRLQREIGDTE